MVAAAVGGLTVAVADGVSGLLVDGHDRRPGPMRWPLSCSIRRSGSGWPRPRPLHAAKFSWDVTVDGLLDSYHRALRSERCRRVMRRCAECASLRPVASVTPDELADALTELGVDAVREGDDAFLVTLAGERRHRTLVWLVVGAHHVLVESFVCRAPDENAEQVYRFLLQRNARLRSVAYALDAGRRHPSGRQARARTG